MSERGLPITDGAPACPFVAFEDDRDERAASPDHRHRCYAEVRPAPRALAHQEAYCLSSAFPVCPTFQDWARREAAHARRASATAAPEPGEAQRNPPRDWSAPPPWLGRDDGGRDEVDAGHEPERDRGAAPPETPGFLAARPGPESGAGAGLAGSRADRLAGVDPDAPVAARTRDEATWRPTSREAAIEDAGAADDADDVDEADDGWEPEDERPAVGGSRRAAGGGSGLGRGDRRPRVGETRRRDDVRGPSWERPQRYEAYPTIKTRVGMPGVPRIALLAAALVIAAIALFILPTLLGVGGPGNTGRATPSPSVGAPSASIEASPSAQPAPTAQLYTVKSGDTLSKIAKRFGVSLDNLILANKETLPNPDKLQIGDQLIIPTPGGGAGGSASPAASAAP